MASQYSNHFSGGDLHKHNGRLSLERSAKGMCITSANINKQLVDHVTPGGKLNKVYFTATYGIECGLRYILKHHDISAPIQHELRAHLDVLPNEYRSTEWCAILAGMTSNSQLYVDEVSYADGFEADRETTKSLVHINELLASDIRNM